MFVSLHCELFSNGADILRAAMRAIEDPEVAAVSEKGDRRRRQVIDGWFPGGTTLELSVAS